MQHSGVWKPNCPISVERLKLVTVSHLNFDGLIKPGQFIVLDKLAESALKIFEELMLIKFPIHQIELMDKYKGNDDQAMAANNSSAFNFRPIAGSDKVSMHSYGLAIDVNPVQNPCIVIKDNNEVEVHPKIGVAFLNRNNIRPGMLEPVVPIFKKHGFTEWGGNWNTPIDYHHFQVPRSQVEDLLVG
jgi:hypothetical protein